VLSGEDHGADDGFVDSFPAGSRVGRYRLEERIGRGGMAVVFRAGIGVLGLARRNRPRGSPGQG